MRTNAKPTSPSDLELVRRRSASALLALAFCFANPLGAAEPDGSLPRWFEEHRVQAHFENAIQDDLAGLYQELHPGDPVDGGRGAHADLQDHRRRRLVADRRGLHPRGARRARPRRGKSLATPTNTA